MLKIIMFSMFSSFGILGQGVTKPEAQLIHRCLGGQGGCSGYDAVMEDTLNFGQYRDQPDTIAVVRVCSKEPTPIAFSVASMNPLTVADWLENVYNFTPERILLLRSEDCQVHRRGAATTELWAIPQGATLPTHVDAIKPCQFPGEYIGVESNEPSPGEGDRHYRRSMRELVAKLRANPRAVGVVLGYYLKRPRALMKQRLKEVELFLRRSGVPHDRFSVRVMPWIGGYSISPPDPEPENPSMYVVEVTKDCHKR